MRAPVCVAQRSPSIMIILIFGFLIIGVAVSSIFFAFVMFNHFDIFRRH